MTFTKRIIVGGLPRSGSTLLRFLLDASPSIISGPETAFLTKPLELHQARAERSCAGLARVLGLEPEPLARCIDRSHDTVEAFDGVMSLFGRRAGKAATPCSWWSSRCAPWSDRTVSASMMVLQLSPTNMD